MRSECLECFTCYKETGKKTTHTLSSRSRGRRHENACKIAERKNGNTARATVNNNATTTTVAVAAAASTESSVRILSLQLVLYLLYCACVLWTMVTLLNIYTYVFTY